MNFVVFVWKNRLFRYLFLLNIVLNIPLLFSDDSSNHWQSLVKSEVCQEALWSNPLKHSKQGLFSSAERVIGFSDNLEMDGALPTQATPAQTFKIESLPRENTPLFQLSLHLPKASRAPPA